MRSQAEQKATLSLNTYQKMVDNHDWHGAYTYLKQILWENPGDPVAADQIAQLTNKIAMVALRQRDYPLAEQFLRRSIRYSRLSPYLTLVTYNNWSCYYKKTQNNSMALLSISKAMALANYILEEEPSVEKIKYVADSHLNLCVVLSQMGEHRQALDNARMAVKMLEKERECTGKQSKEFRSYKSVCDRNQVMAIARYNLAVELEHLKKYDEAKEAYTILRDYMKEWDDHNPLLKKAEKALESLDYRSKSQGNRRSNSRTSSKSNNKRRLHSLFKLCPSSLPSEIPFSQPTITTYLDKQVDVTFPSTPHHTLNLKKVLQQRSTNNNTALSTLSHTRSHTSDRPLSGKPPIGHRRTMTKMLPLKGRFSSLLDD